MTILNLAAIRKAHAAFVSASKRVVDSATQDASQYEVENAKQRLTVHNRTGRLMRSTSGKILRLPNERIVRLANYAMSNGVGYASYVDKGNGDGYIYPKRARFLRFRIGPLFIFAKRVRAYRGSFVFTKARRSGFLYAGHLLRSRLQALASSF